MSFQDRQHRVARMDPDELVHARERLDNEMYMRANAVVLQADRIRRNDQPASEYQADLWLFAEAYRATIRAAQTSILLREASERTYLGW